MSTQLKRIEALEDQQRAAEDRERDYSSSLTDILGRLESLESGRTYHQQRLLKLESWHDREQGPGSVWIRHRAGSVCTCTECAAGRRVREGEIASLRAEVKRLRVIENDPTRDYLARKNADLAHGNTCLAQENAGLAQENSVLREELSKKYREGWNDCLRACKAGSFVVHNVHPKKET